MSWFGKKSIDGSQFSFQLSDAEWRAKLGAEAFHVMREHGTERAGTSALNLEKREGVFHCAGCATALFNSADKFESGTGWPSFFGVIAGAVEETVDRSFFMVRTEVHCQHCGSHLGHVFPDGPQPSGLRYCINGVCLRFEPS